MTDLFKYGHTPHLPFSPGTQSEDKLLKNTNHLKGLTVTITEKMDGENTNFYYHRFHARSLDSNNHPSRNYVKGIWGRIKYQIPDGWRICGENMYATHSVLYDNLEDYFLVFSIWDENNNKLHYDDECEICDLLGLKQVPLIWTGKFEDAPFDDIIKSMDFTKQEGFVVQNMKSYNYNDFEDNIAKYVRAKHVQTDEHWMANWRDEPGYVNLLKK
jgi:hypothetical protein